MAARLGHRAIRVRRIGVADVSAVGFLSELCPWSDVNVVFPSSGPDLQDIADQQSMVGQPVQLTVTATDPDRGDILTFQLDPEDAPPRANLEQLDNFSAVIRWTPESGDGSGPFLFRVLVTDAVGLSDQESFTVALPI